MTELGDVTAHGSHKHILAFQDGVPHLVVEKRHEGTVLGPERHREEFDWTDGCLGTGDGYLMWVRETDKTLRIRSSGVTSTSDALPDRPYGYGCHSRALLEQVAYVVTPVSHTLDHVDGPLVVALDLGSDHPKVRCSTDPSVGEDWSRFMHINDVAIHSPSKSLYVLAQDGPITQITHDCEIAELGPDLDLPFSGRISIDNDLLVAAIRRGWHIEVVGYDLTTGEQVLMWKLDDSLLGYRHEAITAVNERVYVAAEPAWGLTPQTEFWRLSRSAERVYSMPGSRATMSVHPRRQVPMLTVWSSHEGQYVVGTLEP